MKAAAVLCSVLLLALPARAEPLTELRQAYKALEAHRYQDVEDLYARLRKEGRRTAEGKYAYEDLQHSVYWYSSSDPKDVSYWPKVDAATKDWVAKSPGSHVPAMTRAYALAYRAGYVQVRDKNWVEAENLANEAAALMAASRPQGRTDPLWHAARLRVASVQGLPRPDVLALVHQAVAVDPRVMPVWEEAAIALSPENPPTEDLVWLMRLAVQRTQTTEGTSMYARVLHTVYWRYPEFRASPFRGGIDWPMLHESFLDWKQRYPASYPVDLHAALACAARDREVTASMLGQRDRPYFPNTWELMGGKEYFRICKDWATATQPGPST